jgi:methionyl-tRNA formyltransferase
VIYAGTPEFAVSALQALLDSTHHVVGVYTQPDRPAGRGRKLTPSPVKQTALDRGVAVYQPKSFKDPEVLQTLIALDADVMVVAAYGMILPLPVLEAPRLGCLNIHASLLPRWRGAAPIQRAIEAGDAETGVTIMQMAQGLDTGDMLAKLSMPIGQATTAQEVHDALALLGCRGLLEVLPALCEGRQLAEPQNDALATYAKKLDKKEAQINWQLPANQIHRQICAFNPFPIAFTHLGDKILRIWSSTVCDESGSAGAPGEVVLAEAGQIKVVAGDGMLLSLNRLQLPGKKPLSAKEFLNGRQLLGQALG